MTEMTAATANLVIPEFASYRIPELEAKVIHRHGPWRTMDAVEYATLEWVDWFNHRRILEPIGDIPPAEKKQMYYQQLEESAMVA